MAQLSRLMREVSKEYERALAPHLEELARTDADVMKTLEALGQRVSVALAKTAGPLFDKHAADVRKVNARAMKVIGIKAHSDIRIASDLEERRKANIDLVVNAGRAYADGVKDIFGNPRNVGVRVEVLKEKLLERGDVSEARAELIARDQTLKLNGALTQIRQENAGVSEYVWSTSNDERVREEHAALEGQVFSWAAPPSVGHPGEDFQCRCVAIPVIPELEGL